MMAGRRALLPGELGAVQVSPAPKGGFAGRAYTRDGGGEKKRLYAAGATEAEVRSSLELQAQRSVYVGGEMTPEEALNGVASKEPVDTADEATTSAVELTAHSGVYQRDGGFQQTLTMRTSSVLSGADMTAVQAAWESVGGTGSVPCAGQSISGTGSTAYVFGAETAGFAVGTIDITNDVPDFDAKPWKFNITGPNSNLGGSMCAVQYPNKTDCAALGTVLISPAWSSGETSWGPTPFVIGVANYRSPEAPDGDAALLEVPIQVLTGPRATLRWSLHSPVDLAGVNNDAR